jgi:hypothetical protein
VIKEVHVAALCQSLDEVYVSMADSLTTKEGAAPGVFGFQKALASETGSRIQTAGFEQGDGDQRFEDRAWRQGHLTAAIEKRSIGARENAADGGRIAA